MTALFRALYIAVSAFNNCGYSLFSDSLAAYRGDRAVNLAVMRLIVLGRIGFIVQYEVIARMRGRQKRLSLHTKLVLLTTGILILTGSLLFYLFEGEHLLKGVPASTQFLDSLFQSITARTPGFSTVAIDRLTNPTILALMILMFIGASPGSTGGRIKTTSFALRMMIWNRRYHVNTFNRQVPEEIMDTIGIQEDDVAIVSFGEDLAAATLTTLPLRRQRSRRSSSRRPTRSIS